MEFLVTLFSSLFANNIVLAGHGLRDAGTFHKRSKSWILIILFFVESIILSLCSLGFRELVKLSPLFKYLSILFFVLISIGCDMLFYLIMSKINKGKFKEEMINEGLSVAINSALLDISLSILLLTDVSILSTFGAILGLPLGFIGSTYVCGAILNRVNTSDQPKGFKGLPLLLISIAGLALAMSSLVFKI